MGLTLAFEHGLARRGALIAGVDEVGRGALAGPVMAAAVILDPARVPDGLDDSKRLSAARRASLYELILRDARAVALACVPARAIDDINIRQASLRAMARAVAGLVTAPELVLVDGRDIPAGLAAGALAIVGGDGKAASIAAASIIAKVSRDRQMQRLAAHYPQYGFERHVGYGTKLHLAMLARHGPSDLHRASFMKKIAPAGAF
ncbi:MAG: ribonuclease HII [Hyphomicrobiales bacterium]|nr:ribonuclease HII [Hyphomicrobiales bacterium]